MNILRRLRRKDTQQSLFNSIYRQVRDHGKLCSPRGQKVLEIENFGVDIPPYVRFANFSSRKLKVNYTKREFAWYLRGDPFDLSIAEHAKLWSSFVDDEGKINSNYGFYVFREGGIDWVVKELLHDPDSRRAVLPILNRSHLIVGAKDIPCTYGLSFRIREGKLKATALMRSCDAIWGFGNDLPIFSMIQEMVLRYLQCERPELECGTYHHHSDSFHVYERHFDMLEKLCDYGEPFDPVVCPRILNATECDYLRNQAAAGTLGKYETPAEFEFTKWLIKGHQLTDGNTTDLKISQ